MVTGAEFQRNVGQKISNLNRRKAKTVSVAGQACAVFIFLLGAITVWSDPKHPVSPAQIVVEQEYAAAKSRYETNQADTIAAWQTP